LGFQIDGLLAHKDYCNMYKNGLNYRYYVEVRIWINKM